jgi:hypothetical protein
VGVNRSPSVLATLPEVLSEAMRLIQPRSMTLSIKA